VLEDKVKLVPETDNSGTLGGPSMWPTAEEKKDPEALLQQYKRD
jgi:hypothetical protein